MWDISDNYNGYINVEYEGDEFKADAGIEHACEYLRGL